MKSHDDKVREAIAKVRKPQGIVTPPNMTTEELDVVMKKQMIELSKVKYYIFSYKILFACLLF